MDTSVRPKRERLQDAKDVVHWLDRMQDKYDDVIFRGQGYFEWPLTPAAWREQSQVSRAQQSLMAGKEQEYFLNWMPDDQRRIALAWDDGLRRRRLNGLCAFLLAEQLVVETFCAECDRVALRVPQYDEPNQFSSLIFPRQRMVPEIRYTDSFAFAQHHGIHTRLLDFSDNPLKALYFAAQSARPAGLLCEPDVRRDFAVVAARPLRDGEVAKQDGFALNLASPVRVRRVLRSQIPYLHAQDGLFLEPTSYANDVYLNTGKWPNLEDLLAGWEVRVLEVAFSARESVLHLLRRRGIDEVTVKPSYENVAKAVAQRF